MNLRKISLAAAAIVAIVPAISQASPEQTALKACTRQFAASIAPGAAEDAYKVVYMNRSVDSPLVAYYARDFNFNMKANATNGGATMARATCSTDLHGNVTAFTLALSEKKTLAAKL
jgi:hypothetical protein